MNHPKKALLCYLLCLLTNSLFASHFIGGEITYECKGDNVYDFTMTIYKECGLGTFCFDSDLECESELIFLGDMTIYRGTEIFGLFRIAAPETTDTINPIINNTCLVLPPNICIQSGVYKFSKVLPPSDLSYTIVYQRCCRNRTILNISEPSATGTTHAVEISPLAQRTCNSSPTFKDFPPLIICNNEALNFDHSATDIDGDRLVYSFCAPLKGGGSNFGLPSDMNGLAPQPESPPPYDSVSFIAGFSGKNPLNGDPVITIDSNTGIITGRPRIQGQYVVGVCVDAYRGNELINTIRRDFQFNVTSCDRILHVDLPTAEIAIENGGPILSLTTCGIVDIQIANNSTPLDKIDLVEWSFETPLGPVISNEWDAADLTFSELGIYEGTFRINPNTACNLEEKIRLELLPDVTADFIADFDTCSVSDIQFIDLSVAEENQNAIQTRFWNFGNNATSDEANPLFFYDEAGTYPVSLKVISNNQCADSIIKEIPYFPLPPLAVMAPSVSEGCQPFSVLFDNLLSPINDNYDITWDFGNGLTSSALSPIIIFEDAGIFSTSLVIKTPLGCTTSQEWPNLITVLPSPTALFSFTPTEPTSLDKIIEFTNETKDADQFYWIFNGQQVNEANPAYEINSSGLLSTFLVVTNQEGCQDSTDLLIDIKPLIRFTLPNAFSPNSDGINDLYIGKGNLVEASTFEMTIWNRYGELIFKSRNPKIGWNGKKLNMGQTLPEGVYTVKVITKNKRAEYRTQTSFVTLIR